MDSLGSDTELRSLGQTILTYTTIQFQFTSAEKSTLTSAQAAVRTTQTKITVRIKQVEILLNAYTNTEIPPDSVIVDNPIVNVPSTTKPTGELEFFFLLGFTLVTQLLRQSYKGTKSG